MEEYSFIGRIRSLTLESARLDTLLPGEEEQRLLLARLYYDEENRLLKKEERLETTLYEYNSSGFCVRETTVNPEGRVVKALKIHYDGERKLQEEGENEKKSYHYNSKGLVDYYTRYTNGIPESVTSCNYDEKGQLIRVEIRDPEGNLLRSCRYKRDEQGLIKEEQIINQEGMLLEQSFFEYSVFHQENWLKRIRSAGDGKGRKFPVEVLYRGISLTAVSAPLPSGEETDPEKKPDSPESPDEKTILFENGTYTGLVNEDGKPHGRGQFKGRDGSLYRGRFRNGLMQGRGDLIGADGRHYTGDFDGNLPHGEGECLWPDGSRYRGSFRKGEMHGIGIFTWPDNSRFTGLFDNNTPTEQGLLEKPSDREED